MSDLLALALLITQRLPALLGGILTGLLWPSIPGSGARTTSSRRRDTGRGNGEHA